MFIFTENEKQVVTVMEATARVTTEQEMFNHVCQVAPIYIQSNTRFLVPTPVKSNLCYPIKECRPGASLPFYISFPPFLHFPAAPICLQTASRLVHLVFARLTSTTNTNSDTQTTLHQNIFVATVRIMTSSHSLCMDGWLGFNGAFTQTTFIVQRRR